MCGIAGILDLNGRPVEARPLAGMVSRLAHRGPDDERTWCDGPIALGHRRLSILDLAGGAQPMQNPAGTLAIVFNGEIFNHVELRSALEARGHRFATRSDTEVILHLYEEYGDACLERMNGQWAFALWDLRKQRLFMARDRVGIQPLYYAVRDSQLVFASEVKGLFAHPAVGRELDPVGLDQVFTYWSPLAPRTVWKGVEQLPPGSALVVEGGKLRSWRWWSFDFAVASAPRDEASCAEELRELLIDATRLRLRADVPTGAYLSGGLDSSLIAALVRRYTDTPLRTFSVTFDDPEYDESRYQADVIAELGTEHSSIRCAPGDVARIFDRVIWHTETPVLRTAPAPLFMLASLVRQHGYKVVLTGEGADELLGGYDLFKEAKLRRFCAAQPGSRLRPRLFERLYPYMKNLQAESPAYRELFFRSGEHAAASPFFSHLPRWDTTSRLRQFYSPAWRAALAGRTEHEDVQRMLPEDFARWEPLAQAQFLEASILLPGYLLSSQGDRMALGNSVEARFPFLDHRVIEFANRLPARMKLRVLDEKHLLKRAAAGLVPESVLRRHKQPYRAPDGVELLGASRDKRPPWVDALLSPERLAADGVFQPLAVQKLVEKFERGRAVGQRDNMALVGIASTQILMDLFACGDGK